MSCVVSRSAVTASPNPTRRTTSVKSAAAKIATAPTSRTPSGHVSPVRVFLCRHRRYRTDVVHKVPCVDFITCTLNVAVAART